MNFKIVAYVSIILAISSLLFEFFQLATSAYLSSNSFLLFFLWLDVLLSIFILLGYRKLAKINQSKFLEVMVYIALVSNILVGIVTSNALISTDETANFIFVVIMAPFALIFGGVVNLLLGIAILKLRLVFGGIVIAIAILYILELPLSFVPFISVAQGVLEAILFFSAAKKYAPNEPVANAA